MKTNNIQETDKMPDIIWNVRIYIKPLKCLLDQV